MTAKRGSRFTVAQRTRLAGRVRALRAQGRTFDEIGAALDMSGQCARYLFKWHPRESDLPVKRDPITLGPQVWYWPPLRPSLRSTGRHQEACEVCLAFEECQRRILEWGKWMLACERPLKREIVSRNNGPMIRADDGARAVRSDSLK